MHCQLGPSEAGHVMPFDAFEPVDALLGRAEGVVIPSAETLPAAAMPCAFAQQVLRVFDGRGIATAVQAGLLR